MAIDTLGLISPVISEDVAHILEQLCTKRIGYVVATGEISYEITTGDLKGTYDHRICFRVERTKWVCQNKQPVRVISPPYLYVEGSPHKSLLGHNCHGGTGDFQSLARWLLDTLSLGFGVDLPAWELWQVKRVDWAEVYNMGSFEAVTEYFRGANAADYPRRSVSRFGLTGLYAAGKTTATKLYHKGVEFRKHDYSRLLKSRYEGLNDLQILANNLLRVEVEIKSDKLEYDFGKLPTISEVTQDYLVKVWHTEVFRLLRDGKERMEVVRQARAVQQRLHQVYPARLANVLFGVWMQLTALGEEAYKSQISKPTFYRQRKQIVDAACDWHDTDVVLTQSLIPEGFTLARGSKWHLHTEHPKITEALEQYRKAA
jgi:II/X family phage/plasmid replication protein